MERRMKLKAIGISTALLMLHLNAMASEPAKSGIYASGMLSYNGISGELHHNYDGSDYEKLKGGAGAGIFVGYDYALNSNITLGVKTGFQYISDIYHETVNYGSITDKRSVSIESLPIMITGKYFFYSGWLVGASAGIDIKRNKYDINLQTTPSANGNSNSNWSIDPIVEVLGGYQWQNGLGIIGSIAYSAGESLNDREIPNSDNKAYNYLRIGVELKYTFAL